MDIGNMNMMIGLLRRGWLDGFRLLIGALAALALVGCGGGGSGGSVGAGTGALPSSPAGTGTLAITVGDAPTDDFDEALLTVTSVTLIGSGGQVLVSEETVTIDLLTLDAATELLFQGEVPAGDYSKIRLQVESIVLNDLDDDGNVVDTLNVDVPANGKVDLNPQGPFTVGDDSVLVIQLDVDARRSFQAVVTGSGQVRFRPVVFVDVIDTADEARVSFLFGIVNLLAAPDGDSAFDLCDARPLTGSGPGDRELDECQRITLTETTTFIGADGEPIEFGAIDDQSPAVVAGKLESTEEGDALVFEALLVDVGDRDSFEREDGIVGSLTETGLILVITPDDPEAPPVELEVVFVDGMLVFDDEGNLLTAGDIQVDAEVRVMGLFVPGDGETPDVLKASAVSIDSEDGEEDEDGVIVEVGEGELLVALDDGIGPEVCVLFDADTDITVVEEVDDAVSTSEGSVDDLQVGVEIEFSGPAEGDCTAADVIIVELDDDSPDPV